MILTKITDPTRDDMIYAAGVFDGEGCASITRRQRKDRQGWSYSASLIIANTNQSLLEWLGERWGGALHQRKATARWNDRWNWVLSGNIAPAAFARDIQPFVRVKAEPLANVIEMMGALQEVFAVRGRGRHTVPEMAVKYEHLYVRNGVLNRRGPSPEPVV